MTQTQALQIEKAIEPMMPGVLEVLTSNMDRTRFARCVYLSVAGNAGLQPCISNGTLQTAMVRAASVGIYPDGIHGAIVPYKDNGVPIATFIPMYRGLIGKAVEGGVVSDIVARVVYDGDAFEYSWGLTNKLEHKPSTNAKTGRKITYAYAIARFKDGREPMFDVMSGDEILAIKARARSQKGPWSTDPGEMAKKTVTKRLCKYLSGLVSDDLQRLISDDDQDIVEAADAEVLDDGSQRPKTPDALKAALKAEMAGETFQTATGGPVLGGTIEPQAEPETLDDPFAEDGQDAAEGKPEAQVASPILDPADHAQFHRRMRFGQLPAQSWEAWKDEQVWKKGMLKEWTPAQVIQGSKGGKREAALRGSLDYASQHYGNDPPAGAVFADYSLAYMEERWSREAAQ